jgi:uncharacterized membrane protein
MDLIRWIEGTGASTWARDDSYAYFIFLIFHVFGMAFLVGGGIAVSLRVLGVGAAARLESFRGFFPVMWIGAMLAMLSGVGLLVAYPAKALTNWIFVLKFACLIAATLLVRFMVRQYFPVAARGDSLPTRARTAAAAALLLWLAGVACGKLLLYTYSILMTADAPR